MAGNEFNLADLYQKYFGLEGLVKDEGTAFVGAMALPEPVEVASNVYGVPIYEQITLFANDESGNPIVDYTFPGWPLISVSSGKKIVKTDMVDAPGSVKEYITKLDKIITIRGLLINKNERGHPKDQIKVLNDVCELDITLGVTCDLLNLLGVNFLVIENIDWPEVEGSIMIQPFTISAISDYPYDLIINDPGKDKETTQQQLAIRQLLDA